MLVNIVKGNGYVKLIALAHLKENKMNMNMNIRHKVTEASKVMWAWHISVFNYIVCYVPNIA